ncbi:tRNA glutamyl-Q(34) synthetase GluQRS [Amphritea japonica]|uniref:Glutamyl-Q tRNA(Asp) synthetase n=1 Tax=Amphritea japonica ATCC BAA-1530 TaxID=1278309 RepID=A0A7R6PNR3_9GAMM|nr:tRNA glutamyl-Q(34) synthetase GluQRS [Amphritea japonica]BBB27680.1 glutamyl-Q tRNA(Asp) synthetase [Amphritea japonica ATCC BAA-1530]
MVYTGRFAPSPTGPLHFGSLLAALASYLDARAHQGDWLIRIEDLDPPREVKGATDSILITLEQFGLHWDGEVILQSHRLSLYNEILTELSNNSLAYPCNCSRQQIQRRSGSVRYDGFCRSHPPDIDQICAIRSRCDTDYRFDDRILGPQDFSDQQEDFVIFRRDGLFAYQIAVTIDDAEQQVSHIVRGSDLLDSTPKQIHLQHQLGYQQPIYAHIPVATNALGQKLSKQTFAPALNQGERLQLMIRALDFLGQQPLKELADSSIEECLSWAVEHWDINNIPACLSISLEES